MAGRPDLMAGRKTLTVYEGMTGMMENAFINVKGVHHTVTAEVELKDGTTNGVIIAQAGYFGGWVLYMKDGLLTAYFAVNTEAREFAVFRRLILMKKDLTGRESDLEDPSTELRPLLQP